MTKSETIEHYRAITRNSLNRIVRVQYKRFKGGVHDVHVKVVKVRKSSLKCEMLTSDRLTISIGFRNIINFEILWNIEVNYT